MVLNIQQLNKLVTNKNHNMYKKKSHNAWSNNEISLLMDNSNLIPTELIKLFPNRTYFSVLSKKNKILRLNELAEYNSQTKIEFKINEPIDDINEVLNQSILRVQELTITNNELVNRIKELEDSNAELTDKYETINQQYEKQQNKVETLASETKSRWAIIKKVFY
jgi:hypothetical protein